MSIEDETVGDFIKNIRVVLWTVGGIISLFSGGIFYVGRLLFTAHRKFNEQGRRLDTYERDLSDLRDRDIGRSAFTKAVYGLSERTTEHSVRIEKLEERVNHQDERCDRRHEE
jgi:hypothetical protein